MAILCFRISSGILMYSKTEDFIYLLVQSHKYQNKKGDIQMNKKAFIAHPATWIIVAFLLGALAMYLIAKKIIPIPINVC